MLTQLNLGNGLHPINNRLHSNRLEIPLHTFRPKCRILRFTLCLVLRNPTLMLAQADIECPIGLVWCSPYQVRSINQSIKGAHVFERISSAI